MWKTHDDDVKRSLQSPLRIQPFLHSKDLSLGTGHYLSPGGGGRSI